MIKIGICALCGQEMISTENDAWHPWDVEQACPPEIDEQGVTVPQWGGFGRPGREHFRPAPTGSAEVCR